MDPITINSAPTVLSYAAVELLVVFGHDFDDILRSTITKQWYEKRAALKTLGYFDHFNAEQLISASKLSVLKQFGALETIYHEDRGEASHAYFVLSGECMILQSLQMKVTHKRFYKTYELLDLSQTKKTDSSQDHAKDKMKAAKEEEQKKSTESDDNVGSDENYNAEINQINSALNAINARTRIKTSTDSTQVNSSFKESEFAEEGHIRQEIDEFDNTLEESYSITSGGKYYGSKSIKINTSQKDGDSEFRDVYNSPEQVIEEQTEQNVETTEKLLSSVRKIKKSVGTTSSHSSTGRKGSISTGTSKPDRISLERRFIDVGSLTFGGIFGLGEKIEDRVIMARTKVQCILLPRYWLFEKEQNTGRIWQRRRFVVDTAIPSRWQLYKDFLKTRKWQKYKNDFIASILDPQSISNPTHYQDIPMMFHIINPVEE